MKTIEVSAVLMIPVLLFGMFGNLNLLSATYRFKQLRNRNGILVALIAFLDFISELHESKNAIEVLSGKSLMPRNVCFRSIFLYLVSFNMACVAILFLAIDRFIAVWSPLRIPSDSAALGWRLAFCNASDTIKLTMKKKKRRSSVTVACFWNDLRSMDR
ncbi:unnamed protein product [Gongylonema pulchrum]|uniref:G_PROTEIN_RECEP_F1_2 domain-containing protein n=1 Tax=Gongylonema pulchrum TaxID=637853 RepID=A0A183EGF2_9BILA|nr:unnamed protein product [Gongylonema pulchrum]